MTTILAWAALLTCGTALAALALYVLGNIILGAIEGDPYARLVLALGTICTTVGGLIWSLHTLGWTT